MGKIVENFRHWWKTNSEFIMKQDLAETEKYLERSNYAFVNVFWWCTQKNQKLFENNNGSGTHCFTFFCLEAEINILFRLLKLLILSKLLKFSVLEHCVQVEKYNKYAKTCFLFEKQNLNNRKVTQHVQLFLHWICFKCSWKKEKNNKKANCEIQYQSI